MSSCMVTWLSFNTNIKSDGIDHIARFLYFIKYLEKKDSQEILDSKFRSSMNIILYEHRNEKCTSK